MAEDRGYTNQGLLAETDWLSAHLVDPDIRVIDCGTMDAYNRAHVPGAVALPVAPQIKDAADEVHVMPPQAFSELMVRLGVGDSTMVVTYDANNSLWAARLWWVLRYYGHEHAKVLNGGWHKWILEGRAVTTSPAAPPPAAGFTAEPNAASICSLQQLGERAADAGILDVRSAEEYAGTNSRGNRRVGHVPGAAHIEWLDFMTRDDRRVFRPAAETQALLAAAKISPDQDVVTYCQAGIRAAHVFFVLSLMGYEQIRNYDGSMREWANRDDTPLVLPA